MTLDAQSVIRIINRAEDTHFILTGMARTPGSTPGPKVQTSTTPGVPLNLTMHDLAVDIDGILRDLALDLADASGDWPDGLDATGAALFARQRSHLIVTHPGRQETVELLADRCQKATGVLGMLPRRTRIPEACECGRDQFVYHENVAFVRCTGGHVASLADHAYTGDTEEFTVSQTARILGVARSTIARMIDRGDLPATGKPPMVPRHALDRFADGLAS